MEILQKKNLIERKGITLISLVVVIIILVLLAGVTIVSLSGENSILVKAGKSKTNMEDATEEEQIILMLLNNRIGEEKIGLQLKQLNFNSSEDTVCIYDSENGQFYKDGWFYVRPEDMEDKNLKSGYIVNYDTNEYIKFDSEKHRVVKNNSLCIKEGLSYTIDAKNMSGTDNWGDAQLYNFNFEDENSGWSENSLMFDGIDDGIELPDNADYSKGISIEMYFKYRGATNNNQIVQILMMKRKTVSDGFFIFLGNGTQYLPGVLYIDLGGSQNRVKTNLVVEKDVPTYITYTFNPNQTTDKGILYLNGEKIYTDNKGVIANLVKVQKNTNIQIGSDVHKTNGASWSYPFNGEIYAARVYDRALSEEEVKFNYEQTVNN